MMSTNFSFSDCRQAGEVKDFKKLLQGGNWLRYYSLICLEQA
jgi:hypothetical protein